MRTRSRSFRLVGMLVAGSILTPLPPLGTAAGAQSLTDPPSRVGRLARLDGTISTHGPGATQWTPAVLNFPFTSGDALWTEPQAQAEIEIGSSAVTLAASTELDMADLDDRSFAASAPQGALLLDLRDVHPGETWTFDTPRGAVQIAASGHYEILSGDASTPTRVVIEQGAAQFTGGALVLRGGAGQMLVASGNESLQGDIEPAPTPDAFLAAMLARLGSSAAPVPQVALGMTGVDQLAAYGSWQQNPQYGDAWYPQVDPGWTPYSEGNWSYVEPWGWTWVDDEPWGFAPFHYGRWFQSRGRWGWTPGTGGSRGHGPTYAPALVDFVAVGAAAGIAARVLAASLRSGHGNVGWIPLGPHEAYLPDFHAGNGYLGRINPGGGWHRSELANRNAMVVAPATALLHSTRFSGAVHGSGRGPAAGAIEPLPGGLALRPIAETRGLTARGAREADIASGPRHPVGPGPAIGRPQPHLGLAHAPGPVPARGPAVVSSSAPAIGAAPGPSSHVATLPRIIGGERPGRAAEAGAGPVGGPVRPPLPHVLTPRSPASTAIAGSPVHRPAVPTVQHPTRPQIQRFQAPRVAGPTGPRPGFQGPRMTPMIQHAAPASPHAAPAAGGRGALPQR